MKFASSLILSGALLLGGTVLAHDDKSPGPINAALLGQYEGVVEFCSSADPQSAKSYDAALHAITQGIRHHDLEEARESAAYRQSFKSILSMLETIPRADRRRACANMFAPSAV